MTTLLKSGAPDAARAVDLLGWSRAARVEAPEVKDEIRARLETEIADLRCALNKAQEAYATDIEKARADAREEAEAAHRRDDAEALLVLRNGVVAALEKTGVHLDRLDDLALVLCETALERIFGETPHYSDLVRQALHKQTAVLRDEAMIHVDVNPEDFPDAEALATLAADLGKSAVAFHHDPALERGACRIQLQLGVIEVSAPRYWADLQTLCRHAAAEAT